MFAFYLRFLFSKTNLVCCNIMKKNKHGMPPKTDFLVALSASISNKIKFCWQYSRKFFLVRRFRVRSVHWQQTNIFFKASLIFILKQIIIENSSHHQLSSTIEPLPPSAHIICNDYCNNPKLIKENKHFKNKIYLPYKTSTVNNNICLECYFISYSL